MGWGYTGRAGGPTRMDTPTLTCAEDADGMDSSTTASSAKLMQRIARIWGHLMRAIFTCVEYPNLWADRTGAPFFAYSKTLASPTFSCSPSRRSQIIPDVNLSIMT